METSTLIRKLAEHGIECDRRTIYKDIQLLNDFGYEILHTRGVTNRYFVVDRSFDIPELRILLVRFKPPVSSPRRKRMPS